MNEPATVKIQERYPYNFRACRRLMQRNKCDYEHQGAREAKTNSQKYFTRSWFKKVLYDTGPLTDESGVLIRNSRHTVGIPNKIFWVSIDARQQGACPRGPCSAEGSHSLEIDTVNEHEIRKYVYALLTNVKWTRQSVTKIAKRT